MTKSSANHCALALYSKNINPAMAQLKSPAKLDAFERKENCITKEMLHK